MRFCLRLLGILGLLGALWGRVDVVVLVPGSGGAGEDGVPDDGFGVGLAGFGRRVDGFEIQEDLLGVPVEEGGQICACPWLAFGNHLERARMKWNERPLTSV